MMRPRTPADPARWLAVVIASAALVGPGLGCGDDTRGGATKAGPARGASSDGIPRAAPLGDYVLVGPAGATAFEPPPAQPSGATGVHVGRGFGFLPTGQTRTAGGRRYLRIFDGRWLPEADLTHVRPSRFAGARLAPGESLLFGWTTSPDASVFADPDDHAPRLSARPRGARVTLSGACRAGFCPLAVGWMRAGDLARPNAAPRPGDVGPRERWIDVDLSSQTLVAYEGDAPRFATLVATGIGVPGSPFETPSGVFRIRSKHAVVRMDNLEHSGVDPYAYDVPLTQYFSEGKALHAAPWHDQLGHPRSHGCINLSPEDARWLFDFTAPRLGAGEAAVFSSRARPGTLVRVRGEPPLVPRRL